MLEKIVTFLMIVISLYILIKHIRKKLSGKCDCNTCSSHCSMYNKENKDR